MIADQPAPLYPLGVDLEVDRSDLRRTRIAAGRPLPDEPSTGSVLCRIDSFALTANNVTYAVVGDMIGYWKFFPSTDEGWGRVPVWGYGDVVASSHPEVAAGERYYGYWPMSSHVLLEPAAVGPPGLTDGTAHRASLPAVYNRYQRVAEDGDDEAEARQALLAPLFATSFLIDDWLGEHDLFGAGVVVLSSASSKTALGLAHLLKEHRRGEVTGLTSAAHVDFVASTGAYDHVLPYDELPAGLGDGPAVYVDMAGDAGVLAAVHRHFGDRLQRSVRVGFTHHDAPAAGGDLPGPAPEMFFAPDHVQRRSADWGAAGFAERLAAARSGFDRGTGSALAIVRHHGADEVVAAWVAAVEGRTDPAVGVICSW